MRKSDLRGIARPWDDSKPPKFEDYFTPWVEEEDTERKESTDKDNKEKRNPKTDSDDRR